MSAVPQAAGATVRGSRRALLAVGGVVTLIAAVLSAVVLSPPAAGAGPAVPGEDSVAVGFSRDMAVHHQQAVEMSFLALDRGTSPDVHTLAYDIANTQANQRGMMLGWLSLWGRTPTSSKPAMRWMHMPPPSAEERREGVLMPGMAGRDKMDELRSARGKKADLLFLRLMTAHHRGGVHMAEGVTEGSAPAPVVRLAHGMVEGQQSEIALMKSLSEKLR